MELNDKVVIITGGSDGLGLATAERLADHGAKVAICGRSPDRLAAAVARLEARGGTVHGRAVDVKDPDALAALFADVEGKWGRLDGLINGAGHHTGGGFGNTSDAEWQHDFELKLLAAVRGSRHAIRMMEKTGGSIVNVLSIWARTPDKGSMPSSVFRAGGLALTKGVANDYAHLGIRSNAILVGFVESNQWVRGAAKNEQSVEDFAGDMVARLGIPLGRMGRAREFADLACYLLSPTSGYITGAAIPVDGGLCRTI